MVANFTICTYGVNQDFRFVEGIWLHRNPKKTCSELPSYISTMVNIMVFILHGSSLYYAHIWRKSRISIC